MDGELGEGLFNAQGCEAGSSVCIPTLPHDFAYDSQSLKRAQSKSNVTIYLMISMRLQCCCTGTAFNVTVHTFLEKISILPVQNGLEVAKLYDI